ncbi:MAG: hypothetical protein Q8Q19_07255, partial [Microbacterium sp.]|nr:hypothetical protein [Microbacterium sp.]
ATWEIEGATGDWADKGLTPIMPVTSSETSVLACAEPATGLADLKGKMIRTGTLGQVGQVEALGATSVNLPYTELYEALQRGIVDCVIASPGLVQDADMLTVAPHLMTPVGASFETIPVSELAGINWDSYPLPVQQLLFDSLNELYLGSVARSHSRMPEVVEDTQAQGGAFHEFDDEVNTVLKEHNEKVLKSLEKTDLLDGQEFVDTLTTQYDEWSTLLEEAGYSTANLVEYDAADSEIDMTAVLDLYRERVIEPYRPH